jgi:histidyl-tRNA synthetase
MTNIVRPVKGTRDFYPADLAVRNWIYTLVRDVSEAFGYQEFDGPFLESIDLYIAKSGEELVKEQSFVFPDRGGDLVALRPELTPSLARMVSYKQQQLVYPLRWWSWGPFWRYERPQKGRSREFFQWNIDLIGVDSPEADAEMTAIAATFLQNAGLSASDVTVYVNNRQLMDSELEDLDIPPVNRPEVFRLIDRRDKLSQEAWEAYAGEVGLSTIQIDGVLSILSDKDLWQKSNELVRFFQVIESFGVEAYIKYAPHIIRGLDYYTGTVFEAWATEGKFRSILGGGRYDNLVADMGGEPLPAVGFAMGDMVIRLVLDKYGCIPEDVKRSPAQVLVTVFSDETFNAASEIASKLRQAGLNVVCYPESVKLGKQFKYGDRMGMRAAVILGPDELENNQVAIKDLRTGKQEILPNTEAVEHIQKLLDEGNPS